MGTISPEAIGIGGALSIAQGYASYKQASAQAEVDEAVRNFNNAEAISALTRTYRNIDDQRSQLAEEAVASSIDAQIVEAQTKGSAQASAGASGTGGSAIDMQYQDIEVASARNAARAVMNRERQETQLRNASMSALHQTQSRLDLMPKQKPSKWAYALGAGAQGFRNILAFNGLFTAAGEL